jgi:ABC-type Fe3+ transport system permease subunit
LNNRFFFSRIAVLTLLASVPLALLVNFVQPAQQHAWFNKYAFTNLVSVSVFGKMVLALGWLFAYQKIFHPVNEWFVGIFLYLYVVYTAFEVWFMTRIAKS